MKISWTPTAHLTYFKVLEDLSKVWTIKEVESFIYKTEHTIAQIAETTYMFKASKKKRNVRKGFITAYNSLYYRVKTNKKRNRTFNFLG